MIYHQEGYLYGMTGIEIKSYHTKLGDTSDQNQMSISIDQNQRVE